MCRQSVAVIYRVMEYVAACRNMLQRVAVEQCIARADIRGAVRSSVVALE